MEMNVNAEELGAYSDVITKEEYGRVRVGLRIHLYTKMRIRNDNTPDETGVITLWFDRWKDLHAYLARTNDAVTKRETAMCRPDCDDGCDPVLCAVIRNAG
jgi:hypothetical protein